MKINPLVIAKVIGWLFMVIGILGVSGGLISLPDMSNLPTNPLVLLIQGILSVVVGYGLIKTKKWAINGYLLSIIINLFIQVFINKNTIFFNFSFATIIGIIIIGLELYVFYLFFSNKEKFSN